jgi:U3 small nucleolar ribonucleoprotein component
MAKWQRHLELRDVFDEYRADEATIQQVSAKVADRLSKLRPFPGMDDLNDERDLVQDEFEDLSKNEGADIDDFHDAMDRLYDWADTSLGPWDFTKTPKACWVET